MNPLDSLPDAALADVLPAVAAGWDLPGSGALSLPVARDVVVLLVDGLGAELVAAHADIAPTLTMLTVATIRAGFPATTATSLSSLSVGAPCGVHGIVGYSFVPDDLADGPGRVLNSLRWTLDVADGPSAVNHYPPQRVQSNLSFLQQFSQAGIDIAYVTPGYQRDSPLTRAVFRERGTHHSASTPDEVRDAILSIARTAGTRRRFVYAYFGDLDLQGHLHGPGSAEWRTQLAGVEAMVAALAEDLPASCTLVVTGDHGMVPAGHIIDVETTPDLQAGVVTIAGEARVRHVYVEAGARDAVAQAWASTLGHHAQVVTRDQAIDEGWFGAVNPGTAARIGDVVAVARGHALLTRSVSEPLESSMAGHHGAWTTAEQLVPLLVSGG